VNQGAFHEAANLAAIWDLPVIFVCENNVYAEFTDSRRMARVAGVADRAAAYGIPPSWWTATTSKRSTARRWTPRSAAGPGTGPC
jgi:hypothetical protein